MDLSQLLFGVFSGDMGALSVLFILLLPFVLIGSGISTMINRHKEKKQ
jgi:hypothetical protein